MQLSTSATEPAAGDSFLMPTETEIYIMPDGEVVFADLPAELVGAPRRLGRTKDSCDLPGDVVAGPGQSPAEDG